MLFKPGKVTFQAAFVFFLVLFFPFAGSTQVQKNKSSSLYPDEEVILGITQSWQNVVLGSVKAGKIARIIVQEGQTVEKGQMLATLDSSTQQLRVEMARTLAKSTVEIELAKVKLEAAENKLNRLTHLNQHAPEKEIDEATSEVETARLEIKKAELNHLQAIQSAELEELILEQLNIRAPFSGIVTELIKRVGETVDVREGILAMVELDPLAVSLNCPLRLASRIRPGDRLMVQPVDRQWGPKVGEVVFMSRVADAASQTFRLKLKVKNEKNNWVSGLKVRVDLGKAVARGIQIGEPPVRQGDG
jgi:multidrug efflux system membrane fusion protein